MQLAGNQNNCEYASITNANQPKIIHNIYNLNQSNKVLTYHTIMQMEMEN